MFIARSLVHGSLYGVLYVASESRALLAMIGSMGLVEWGTDHLSRLLLDAAGNSLDDDAPRRLAAELLARLAAGGEPAVRPTWLLFAAALVKPGSVEVSHAGDLRVEVVRGEQLLHATRDHTLGNLGAVDPTHPHRNVVVRSLKHGEPPPDHATWSFDGTAQIRIASSDVHAYREGPIVWPGAALAERQNAGAFVELEVMC